jgi:undecaprenyl-diphosphatase
MIDYSQAFWLALIQGLTEFLPISSSGHLALVPALLGWPDQGLAFDVAVHVGSLLAVLVYFRQDVKNLTIAIPRLIGSSTDNDVVLLRHLMAASLPVLVVGFLLQHWIEQNLRGAVVIGSAMIGFAFVLLYADSKRGSRTILQMLWWTALIIGLAQVLALIPGTSRSGITISAALLLGFTRIDAARFSFLLSIPIILLAGLLKGTQLVKIGVDWQIFAFGIAVSAISAYLCVALFLRLIERIGILPFVLYRIILGCAIFAVIGF